MKLETFFEKFDELTETPKGVKEMRGLVLLLAVQGKLVDQLPSDEPATKLHERIQKSKELLIKERVIRRQETVHIDCDSAPFPIPPSWVWTRLGEIGDWGSGSTPPRGNHDLYDGGITWLKSGELNDNLALAGSSETVTELALKTGSFRRNQQGDVLFAMYGATIGKVAILAEPAVTNQAVCGCTPFEGVSNRYLFNYLVSQRAAFHEASEGGAQPNLSKVKIVAFPFPLPPLAEQERIVAKVDELMALCDRLEAQQQEREEKASQLTRASLARFADAPNPANLNFIFHKSFDIPPADLRKSILTLAVQGKLVPQDPNDEPAAELISQIAEEKRRLVSARIIRDKDEAAPITDGEISFEVPYGWEWARLSSITRRIHYGYTASAKSDLKDVRLLRITDIQNNFVDWPSVPGCEIAKEDVDQYQLERGDILVARTGGTVGKTYLVQDVPVVAVFASYLIRIQGGTSVFDRYLKLFLESPTYWVQLEEGARGAAQPNVNGQTLGNMVVSVPPLAEQRRIVAKVEQLMALVDALETQLAASRDKGQKLLEAVVAELTLAS